MGYSFFLGANSKNGFFSYYDHLIDLKKAQAVYIIKGSPGGGKSSFMRRIAKTLESAGQDVEYIHCSSDPQSLDGIVCEKLGVAVVDGTAPHVVEAQYPYAVDRYLHLGSFVDTDIMEPRKEAVIAAMRHYRECYAGAYRCISAVASIDADMFAAVFTREARDRALRRVAGIVEREIPEIGGTGIDKRRFLSAVSPDGCITLPHCEAARIFEIEDTYGLAHFLLVALRDAALAAGHDVYSCYSPIEPETRMEHLIVPGLSLIFTTNACEVPYRRVRLDAYLDDARLARHKQKLKFLRRTRGALLDEAVAELAEARRRHDELEQLYNDAIDFDGLYAYADKLCAKILTRSAKQTN